MQVRREYKKEKRFFATTSVAIFFCFWQFFSVFPFFIKAKAEPVTWSKIATFSTWFSQKDVGRCENIALASSFLDGVTLQPYGVLSFNQTVGERTAKRGYKQAKIIVNGEYTQGIGGGVCQVSTTLYNAVLLSGLEVLEFHPHSLSVGYVDPSRDAMVSSTSDLKIFNPFETPIRIRMSVKDGGVYATIYAKEKNVKNTSTYKLCVCVLTEIPPPERMVRQGAEDYVLQYAKNGVESEAYLERYENGSLVSRKRIRKDVYAPVREIIVKKIDDTTKKIP